MLCSGPGEGLDFTLSSGSAHDSPQAEKLLKETTLEFRKRALLIMDRAYEGESVRKTAKDKGLTPIVPPKSNRKEPWKYDKEAYKKRNEVERLFHRMKNFRRIATRYDKLDVIFSAFISLSLIYLRLKNIC